MVSGLDPGLQTPAHRVRRTRTPQELSEPKAVEGGQDQATRVEHKAQVGGKPSTGKEPSDAKLAAAEQPSASASQTSAKEHQIPAAPVPASGKGKGGQPARPADVAVKKEPASPVAQVKQEVGVKEEAKGCEHTKKAAAKTLAKPQQELAAEDELEFPDIPPEPKVKHPETPSTVQRSNALQENMARGETRTFPDTPRTDNAPETPRAQASPAAQPGPGGTAVAKRRQRRPKTVEEKKQHALYMRFTRAMTGQVCLRVWDGVLPKCSSRLLVAPNIILITPRPRVWRRQRDAQGVAKSSQSVCIQCHG